MSTLYVNNIEPVSGSELTLISASLVTLDNLSVTSLTSSFQGDLAGTASFAISASYAVSASHEIIKEVSSSYADFAESASYAVTAVEKAPNSPYTIDAVSAVSQAQYDALTPSATTLYFII